MDNIKLKNTELLDLVLNDLKGLKTDIADIKKDISRIKLDIFSKQLIKEIKKETLSGASLKEEKKIVEESKGWIW